MASREETYFGQSRSTRLALGHPPTSRLPPFFEVGAAIESSMALSGGTYLRPSPQTRDPLAVRQYGGTDVGSACLEAKDDIHDGSDGIERISSTHERSSKAYLRHRLNPALVPVFRCRYLLLSFMLMFVTPSLFPFRR